MIKQRNSRGFAHHFIVPILAIFAVGAIGVATLNLSSAATTCKGRLFTKGSSSVCVKYAAQMLNAVPGTGDDIKKVDTVFGTQTYNKTKRFQSKVGLKPVDGKIGKNTWNKLCSRSYSGVAATAKSKACSSSSTKKADPLKDPNASVSAKKKACNAKFGYVWTSSACKNLRKVCVDNDGTWNDKTKKCTAKTSTKSTPKVEFVDVNYCDWKKVGDGGQYRLVCMTKKGVPKDSVEYNKLWHRNDDAWNACRSYEKKENPSAPASSIERYCNDKVTKP